MNCVLFRQELGLYKAQTKLPFNAFGTMAMAREVKTLNLLFVLANAARTVQLNTYILLFIIF